MKAARTPAHAPPQGFRLASCSPLALARQPTPFARSKHRCGSLGLAHTSLFLAMHPRSVCSFPCIKLIRRYAGHAATIDARGALIGQDLPDGTIMRFARFAVPLAANARDTRSCHIHASAALGPQLPASRSRLLSA